VLNRGELKAESSHGIRAARALRFVSATPAARCPEGH
jgi:hypothetical protein